MVAQEAWHPTATCLRCQKRYPYTDGDTWQERMHCPDCLARETLAQFAEARRHDLDYSYDGHTYEYHALAAKGRW